MSELKLRPLKGRGTMYRAPTRRETNRREIPLCTSRPARRSERGRKASACSVRSRRSIRDAKGANDSGGGVSRYVGAKAPTPERRPARGRRDKGWPTRRTLSNVTRTLESNELRTTAPQAREPDARVSIGSHRDA